MIDAKIDATAGKTGAIVWRIGAIGSRIDEMRGMMADCAIGWKTSATVAKTGATVWRIVATDGRTSAIGARIDGTGEGRLPM